MDSGASYAPRRPHRDLSGRRGTARRRARGAARCIDARRHGPRWRVRSGLAQAHQSSRPDNLTAMTDGRPFKVGVTIHPQQCTIQQLRDAWRRADDLGVDSIWFWDHFFPLYGNPNGNHFECWSLLAAAAIDTRAPQIGPMVSCIGYRNPDMIASVAATVDQLSGGRLVLGLGAGWFERDYAEYGYEFGETRDRVRTLKEALPRIRSRIAK